MARKQIKKITPVAYKQTLKNLHSWVRDNKLDNKISRRANYYRKQLEPYFTKSGTLKKRLSQKRIKEFNLLIERINKDEYSTASKRKEYKQKQERSDKNRFKTGYERGTYRDREHYENAQDLFTSVLYEELRDNGYLDSDQIIDLSQDLNEFTEDDIESAFQYLYDTLLVNTPDEIKNHLPKEDTYVLAKLYLYAKQEGINLTDAQPSLITDMIFAGDTMGYLEKLRVVLNNTDYQLALIDSIDTLDSIYYDEVE